jgi:hypothetical protein
MASHLDAIPVLTEAVEDEADYALAPATALEAAPELDLGGLEAQLTATVQDYASELVHQACRDMEAVLIEQVTDRLKARLPTLIAEVLDEHFRARF